MYFLMDNIPTAVNRAFTYTIRKITFPQFTVIRLGN
jgi:hypothetical protein